MAAMINSSPIKRLALSLVITLPLLLFAGVSEAKKSHSPPSVSLQTALQKFLQAHKGRLLKLEYESENQVPYYRIEFLDGQGVVQHVRVWEKGQQNLTQPVKGLPSPPANLLSLPQLLNRTFGKQPVRLLEASLKPHKAGFQYKLEWIDARGIVWEGRFDARTGRQISRKRD
ncbi:hypothetical protein COW20_05035 [bacterium (Candidatus Blackallbacteria) CG13_big_fil_rev_8_21_14_2_50_49_14]|nr:MAG: hypothetical protein COW20_05035 [bacterium (Candidatus Blackallbacteria) CG13_big_fil_rev_8_21_14_2_50_49_14]